MVIKTKRQYKQHVKSRKTMKGGAYQPFKTNQEIFSEIIKAAGSLSRTKLVEKIISYLKSGGEKGTKFLFFRFNSIRKGQKWFKLYGGIKSLLEKLNAYFYGDNTISNIPDKILSAKKSLIEFIAKKNKVSGRFSSIKYNFKHETQILLLLFLFLSSKPVPLLPDQYLQVVMNNLESSINKESTDNHRLQSAINAITTYLKYTNFVDKTENIKLDFITIASKIIDTINKLVITSINQIAAAESNAKQTLTNLSKTFDTRLDYSQNLSNLRQEVSRAEQNILNTQKENRIAELTRKLEQATAIRNQLNALQSEIYAERAKKRETTKQRAAEQRQIKERRKHENKRLGVPEDRSTLSRIFRRRNLGKSIVTTGTNAEALQEELEAEPIVVAAPAPVASTPTSVVAAAVPATTRPIPAPRPATITASRPIPAPRPPITSASNLALVAAPAAVPASVPAPAPTNQSEALIASSAAPVAAVSNPAAAPASVPASPTNQNEALTASSVAAPAAPTAEPVAADAEDQFPPFAPPTPPTPPVAPPGKGGFRKLKHRKTHKHISSKKNTRNKKNNNRMSRKHKLSKRNKKSKNRK